MSDTQQGPGWWQASDGKWYPPDPSPSGVPTSSPGSDPASAGTSDSVSPGEPAPTPTGGPAAPDPTPVGGPAPTPTSDPAPAPVDGPATPPLAPPVGGPAPAPAGAGYQAPPPAGYGYPQGPAPTGSYPPGYAGPQTTSGLAITSLILSIVWIGGLGSIAAVILAIVALRRIRAAGGRIGGRGLSIAGLIIGIVGILGAILVWSLVAFVGSTSQNSTVPVGQTINVSKSFSLGISTMTVNSVSTFDGRLSKASSAQLPLGDKFVVANVQVCAGPSGSKTGVFNSLFWLTLSDGQHATGLTSIDRSPNLDGRSISANSCRQGYVTFEVISSVHVNSISYHGFPLSTFTWTLPASS